MNKNQVLDLLRKVKYPGFSRDIVSFGMVKNIEISETEISLTLNISSQNKDKKVEVFQEVENLLSTKFQKVSINLSQDTKSETPPTALNEPLIDGVKHIIAVGSGKGGVGKSTIAANIACAMKKRGVRVGLLDLDIYGPSLPIIFDLSQRPKMTQEKKLIPLDKYGIKLMSFGFISGNDTPVIWRGPLVSRMTEQFFRDVEWGELDILILDLPPGTGDIQLTLTQKLKMTGAIIVTTPQDIALADVRKGADMFRKVHTPVLGVIENMSGFIIEGQTNFPMSTIEINGKTVQIDPEGNFHLSFDLFKTGGGMQESERLGVPLLSKIPFSEEIMYSTDNGQPISCYDPMTKVGKIYFEIVDHILNTIEI